MSGGKEIEDSRVTSEKQIMLPEPIPKHIAEVEAHNDSDLEEVVVLENIVPEPELIVLADTDSDTEVGADHASKEVQDLKNKVLSLEKIWKMERLLNSQLVQAFIEIVEGQDKLKDQIDKMGIESSIQSEASGSKRKLNVSDLETSGNNQGDFKKKGKCTNCGNFHQDICRKGKPTCYRCGQEGHVSPYCPQPGRRACFVCESLTHLARDCPNEKND